MFADEGIGVHLCKLLEKNYKFTHSNHSLDFVDGGTLALQLSYIIAEYDKMIVLDCIDADDSKIGDVFFFPYDAMGQQVYSKWCIACHGEGMPGTNALSALYKDQGIPALLEDRTDLSPDLVTIFFALW